VRQRVRWPDPRKPGVIRDESHELGPGGGSYGVISLAGEPTSKNQERGKPSWGYFMRESGKVVKWR
jgi:hypothetical protein